MEENCQNCPYIQSLQKEVEELKSSIKDSFDAINDRVDGLDKRLRDEEQANSAREEQIKTIFNMLKDIKDNISLIADRLDTVRMKPGRIFVQILIGLACAGGGVVLTILINKLFN